MKMDYLSSLTLYTLMYRNDCTVGDCLLSDLGARVLIKCMMGNKVILRNLHCGFDCRVSNIVLLLYTKTVVYVKSCVVFPYALMYIELPT